MNLQDLNQLRSLFAKHANPTLSDKMKAYMRNQFEFFGIPSPLRKELTTQFLKEYGYPNEDLVAEVITAMWHMDEREFQNAALQLMDMRKRKFHLDDIQLIEQLITEKS